MKIAISGAVSTGKTTLGSALAETFGLPFIGENLQNMIGPQTTARPQPEIVAAALLECLEKKRAIETAHGEFVVDRSPIDILNFWFAYRLIGQPQTQKIYDLCETFMADYDAVILLPWGVLELQTDIRPGSGIRRNLNRWVQLNGSVTIAGLAYHFVPPGRIINVPKDVVSHGERLRFVKGQIDRINDQ
jgi:predicted ATPase